MASFTREEALDYHRRGRPGKIQIAPTKPLDSQLHLSLAYSPGVAEAVLEIDKDPLTVFELTARANLVAVISNWQRHPGLGRSRTPGLQAGDGRQGCALQKVRRCRCLRYRNHLAQRRGDHRGVQGAGKPPTFGGINLEDIKAPECFEIEERLIEELDIPVFHDDQHGTAIISGAALLNALEVTGKRMENIKVVINGAGASAIATGKFFKSLGMAAENLLMLDSRGVIHHQRRRGHEYLQIGFAIRDQRAYAARCLAGSGRTGGFVDCRFGDARHDQEYGAQSHALCAGQSGLQRSCRSWRWKYARTPSLAPGAAITSTTESNNVLGFPVHFPRRAGCLCHGHQ